MSSSRDPATIDGLKREKQTNLLMCIPHVYIDGTQEKMSNSLK